MTNISNEGPCLCFCEWLFVLQFRVKQLERPSMVSVCCQITSGYVELGSVPVINISDLKNSLEILISKGEFGRRSM